MSEGQKGESLSENFSQGFSQGAASGVAQGTSQSTVSQGSFPSNFQSPAISSGTGDIILNSDNGSGKRKWGIVLVVLVVLVALVGGGVALWRSGVLEGEGAEQLSEGSKQEAYDLLWDFYYGNYHDLFESYDLTVGLTPSFGKIEESYYVLYPVEEWWISTTQQRIEETKKKHSEISNMNFNLPNDENRQFDMVMSEAGIALDTAEKNMDVIGEIYNTFISPLYAEDTPIACDKNDDMEKILVSGMSSVASGYYDLYCKVVSVFNSESGIDDSVFSDAVSNAEGLNNILVKIDPDFDNFEKLLEELSNEED